MVQLADNRQRLEALRAAYEKDRTDKRAGSDLAQFYVDMGWYNQAEDLYAELLERHGRDFSLQLDYGNFLVGRGELDKARGVLERLTTIRPERVEAWNNLGIVCLRLEDHEAAGKAFRKVLEIEPDNAGALLNLGNYHEAKGSIDRALVMFEKAAEARPDFADAWFNLGNARLTMGEYRKAADAFRRALRYHPEFASAHKNLGYCFQCEGDLDEAERNYRKALELNKADSGIHVNLGNLYAARDRYDVAKAHYLRAVRLSPLSGTAWMGLRKLALLKGDVDTYTRATLVMLARLDEKEIASTIGTLRELGLHEKVDEVLGAAERLGRKGDLLDAERMLAGRRSGRDAESKALQKRLAGLTDPPDAVRKCLARVMIDSGEPDKALAELECLKEEDEAAGRMRWEALVAAGKTDEAEQAIRSYLDVHEDCCDCWYFLARIAVSKGDEQGAREALASALEDGFTDHEAIVGDDNLRRIYESLARPEDNNATA